MPSYIVPFLMVVKYEKTDNKQKVSCFGIQNTDRIRMGAVSKEMNKGDKFRNFVNSFFSLVLGAVHQAQEHTSRFPKQKELLCFNRCEVLQTVFPLP